MTATVATVKAINGATLDDAAVQPFIDAAGFILTGISACLLSRGLTDPAKDAAQAWLAAHLMAMAKVGEATGIIKRETFENYTVERAVGGFSGAGIVSTPYGQTANTLTGGCLLQADKAPALVAFFG